MSLEIQQADNYVGDDRWDWSVWIDGPDAELDEVESVEWVLHPTYPDPIVVVKQRDKKFRLDASGWGEFEINAHLTAKDGHRQHLKHYLQLTEPGGGPAQPATEEKPAVFISAGLADAAWEQAVHDALTRRGFDVLTANDLPAGAPVEAAISSTLDRASTVVGIFSARSRPWAEREVTKALQKDVSVIPVIVDPDAKIPARLQRTQALHVSNPGDVDAAIGRIVHRLV